MTVPSLNVYTQGLDVVSADQLNTYVQTAENTTQLRALIGLPGMEIVLQGITVPNDGGGGSFYWNPTALGPDDNQTVIVPQPGIPGAWVRLTLSESQVTVVPNIAALRALLGGPSAVAVWVEGYYTPGDGGGGAYTYIPTDLTSPDNGGTKIIDAQNHRYYSNWSGTGMVTDKLFGAHVDGVTNDQPFIQNAVNYLESNQGGKLTLVAGTRVINGGVFINTGGITIEGLGWADSTGDLTTNNTFPTKGSIILTTTTAQPVFTLQDPAMGTQIRNIAFRQTQPADTAGWTPIVYPPAIFIQGAAAPTTGGSDTILENLFFWDIYVAIQIGSSANNTVAAHVSMDRIWGMPLGVGIDIQNGTSVWLNEILFTQFDRNSNVGIRPWMLAHSSAIQVGVGQGGRFNNLTLVGYFNGIVFFGSAAGVPEGFQLSNTRIVNCQFGIVFSGAGPANSNISGFSTNYWYEWNQPYNGQNGNAIRSEASATVDVDWANTQILGVPDSAMVYVGAAAAVGFTNLRIGGWNLSGSNNAAIVAAASNTVTLGGLFVAIFGGAAPVFSGGGTLNNSHVN